MSKFKFASDYYNVVQTQAELTEVYAFKDWMVYSIEPAYVQFIDGAPHGYAVFNEMTEVMELLTQSLSLAKAAILNIYQQDQMVEAALVSLEESEEEAVGPENILEMFQGTSDDIH